MFVLFSVSRLVHFCSLLSLVFEITCLHFESSTLFLAALPPLIIMPRSTVVAFAGMSVVVSCTAPELWRMPDIRWEVKCGRCRKTNETWSTNTTIQLTFEATMEWNGATIWCSAERVVSQKSSSYVVVRRT